MPAPADAVAEGIADLIVYLASARSTELAGAIVAADGGFVAR